MDNIENFVELKKIDLKKSLALNEQWVQNIIEQNPKLLGLGDLSVIKREKFQSSGGKLDFLMEDDGETRYTIEIQLGNTNPEHIIRTLEYWETEKTRNPNNEHVAVLIAEEITDRFYNVIQLFRGCLPIIAIKMTCIEVAEKKYSLIFTKIIDKISKENEDEYKDLVDTNKDYWINRSNTKMVGVVDKLFKIFHELNDDTKNYELKYNKHYIGICKNSIANNFISFKPQKQFVRLKIRGIRSSEQDAILDNTNFDYKYKDNCYYITVTELNLNNDNDINIIKIMMEEALREFDK